MLPVTGPNHVALFKADGELSELNSKLLLYYTPQVNEAQDNTPVCLHQISLLIYFRVSFQAFKSQICLDLAPHRQHDGRLTGHRVVSWDTKVGYESC